MAVQYRDRVLLGPRIWKGGEGRQESLGTLGPLWFTTFP